MISKLGLFILIFSWKIVQAENNYHIVLSGETLSSISFDHFGTIVCFDILHKKNLILIKDRDNLEKGTKLALPTQKDCKRHDRNLRRSKNERILRNYAKAELIDKRFRRNKRKRKKDDYMREKPNIKMVQETTEIVKNRKTTAEIFPPNKVRPLTNKKNKFKNVDLELDAADRLKNLKNEY